MATWAPAMFGDVLVSNDGIEVKTVDALAGKTVGVYFSAHWCPPCRQFTPMLAGVYDTLKREGREFEVVFASSDRTDADFAEYHKSMPWLAVPFANRDAKAKLSSKFKVQGIPTLVILDENGALVTKDGRRAVAQPEKFPWTPPTLTEALGETFVDKSGGETTLASIVAAGKNVGLYFSAHWCGPCRQFTPKLKELYAELVASVSFDAAAPAPLLKSTSSGRPLIRMATTPNLSASGRRSNPAKGSVPASGADSQRPSADTKDDGFEEERAAAAHATARRQILHLALRHKDQIFPREATFKETSASRAIARAHRLNKPRSGSTLSKGSGGIATLRRMATGVRKNTMSKSAQRRLEEREHVADCEVDRHRGAAARHRLVGDGRVAREGARLPEDAGCRAKDDEETAGEPRRGELLTEEITREDEVPDEEQCEEARNQR